MKNMFHRRALIFKFQPAETLKPLYTNNQSPFTIQVCPAAFTLTELLVSMAILSALILLLFSVVDNTTKVWNQSEQRVDAFREARAALFVMARDLQSMVSAPDVSPVNNVPDFNYFFVYRYQSDVAAHPDIDFGSVNGIADLATTPGSASKGEGDRLFFLTDQTGNSQGGAVKSDVCSVGYYLGYSSTVTGNQPTFKLHRYFRNSKDTYQNAGSGGNLKDYASGSSPILMKAINTATGDEVLAHNVVDFRIVPYLGDYISSGESMSVPTTWDAKATPYAVDLSITAYNYAAANRFLDRADWMNFTSKKNAPSRQEFSTRIFLPRN